MFLGLKPNITKNHEALPGLGPTFHTLPFPGSQAHWPSLRSSSISPLFCYRTSVHTASLSGIRLDPCQELAFTHVHTHINTHACICTHTHAAAAAKSLQSCPTVRPQRWQPTRLHRPWDSPGKNTGVGCHFLLQCMKVKSESEVTQSYLTLPNPMDCSLPGSSIHGIFQARAMEWGAIAFSDINYTSI